MFKKNTIGFILCISITNYLYAATPLLNLFHHKPSPHITQENERKNLSDEGYTNFTGTWESPKCMGMPVTLRIENTLDFFVLNDEEPMMIGTMTTSANSGVKEYSSISTNNETRALEWNEQKTQLIMKAVSITKSFTDDITPDSLDDIRMHLTMTHVTLSIDNEQLKLQFNTADYIDLQRVDSSHPTCFFTKQVDS